MSYRLLLLMLLFILPLALNGCQSPKSANKSKPISVATGEERGRVHVANGTVLTDRNTILCGASMMILAKPGYANDENYWRSVHELGINAIRLDVKTVQVGKTVDAGLSHKKMIFTN